MTFFSAISNILVWVLVFSWKQNILLGISVGTPVTSFLSFKLLDFVLQNEVLADLFAQISVKGVY